MCFTKSHQESNYSLGDLEAQRYQGHIHSRSSNNECTTTLTTLSCPRHDTPCDLFPGTRSPRISSLLSRVRAHTLARITSHGTCCTPDRCRPANHMMCSDVKRRCRMGHSPCAIAASCVPNGSLFLSCPPSACAIFNDPVPLGVSPALHQSVQERGGHRLFRSERSFEQRVWVSDNVLRLPPERVAAVLLYGIFLVNFVFKHKNFHLSWKQKSSHGTRTLAQRNLMKVKEHPQGP